MGMVSGSDFLEGVFVVEIHNFCTDDLGGNIRCDHLIFWDAHLTIPLAISGAITSPPFRKVMNLLMAFEKSEFTNAFTFQGKVAAGRKGYHE